MMAKRKLKKSRSPSKVQVVGLILDDANDFFKRVCSELKKCLGLSYPRTQSICMGTRELRYICDSNPVYVSGSEKPLPALPLYVGEMQSVWLVIEVECEGGRPAMLQQVSLKAHQGPTTETAELCFRAEWDLRDPGSQHAQPHWNVHVPGLAPSIATLIPQFDFDQFAAQQRQDTFVGFTAEKEYLEIEATHWASLSSVGSIQPATCGFTPDQMHRFHFAMAVGWQDPSGGHSPIMENPDQMVQWIAKCATYVRSQFVFMM